MRNIDMVVVGASAGGVEALRRVTSGLPAGLDAGVFVSLHLPPGVESVLPQLLARAGTLPASHPPDGALIETGRIYCAPPDRHLLFADGHLRVVRGPRENRHRPSIDVMFRSAAAAFGERLAGVLLTGSDDDGAAGLKMIQNCGGVTVVQDPRDSAFPIMPQSALQAFDPDYVLSVGEIGPMLGRLVNGELRPEPKAKKPESEKGTDRQEIGLPIDISSLGVPTAFSCPDCTGTLWELADGDVVQYRCRVGHAYSANSMLEAEADSIERALWSAVRALEEGASVARRIAEKSSVLRKDLTRKAAEQEEHARVIRNLLLNTAG